MSPAVKMTSKQSTGIRAVADIIFSWRRLRVGGVRQPSRCSAEYFRNPAPAPRSCRPLLGRILPLVVRHRQLATWKVLLFRNEELATPTKGRPPNRYWVGKWCSTAKHEFER